MPCSHAGGRREDKAKGVACVRTEVLWVRASSVRGAGLGSRVCFLWRDMGRGMNVIEWHKMVIRGRLLRAI